MLSENRRHLKGWLYRTLLLHENSISASIEMFASQFHSYPLCFFVVVVDVDALLMSFRSYMCLCACLWLMLLLLF